VAVVVPLFSNRKLLWRSTGGSVNSATVLALMSSLFDSFFGFIFWGVAYFRMRRADGLRLFQGATVAEKFAAGANVVIVLVGAFFLTVGTWSTVNAIVESFASARTQTTGVFSCASNAL
jgi:hypothetical protein